MVIIAILVLIILALAWMLYDEKTFRGYRIRRLIAENLDTAEFIYDIRTGNATIVGKNMNIRFDHILAADTIYTPGKTVLGLKYDKNSVDDKSGKIVIENGKLTVHNADGLPILRFTFLASEDRVMF